MEIGRLTARVVIGGLFVGHGTQKLFGWFGGPGVAGTEQMMGALRMYPTRRNALAAGVTEAVSGGLLAVGLATPLAAAGIMGTMITAVRKVHLPNGPWVSNGGWEYNVVLVAALMALADTGPGELSLDAELGTERSGLPWALGALALGAVMSTLVIEMGGRNAPPAPAPSGPVADAATDGTAGDPVTTDEA